MDTLSATAILTVFYLVFAAQIYIVSIHYPRRVAATVLYVVDHFPPAEYPRLYPKAGPDAVATVKRRFSQYLWVNRVIALMGLGLIGYLIFSGFEIPPEGGGEGYAAAYFLLQAMPYLYLSVRELKQFKAMQAGFRVRQRSAELRPRRLSDYVAPRYVVMAVVALIAWAAFYLYAKGPVADWKEEVLPTLLVMTLMNGMFALIVRHFIWGKRMNPYAGNADYQRQVEVTVKSLIFTSIGCSVFLIITAAADRYAFEAFDPILTSLYLQACVALGIGFTLHYCRPELMDFEVYREGSSEQTS